MTGDPVEGGYTGRGLKTGVPAPDGIGLDNGAARVRRCQRHERAEELLRLRIAVPTDPVDEAALGTLEVGPQRVPLAGPLYRRHPRLRCVLLPLLRLVDRQGVLPERLGHGPILGVAGGPQAAMDLPLVLALAMRPDGEALAELVLMDVEIGCVKLTFDGALARVVPGHLPVGVHEQEPAFGGHEHARTG
eukprot:CAMPEP_0174289394 /NCGR_PEP_ID=MMETSP0809-20121228/24904_1 /TAXON_ID=73025 ORGANISM="Eutreptiella gymnastica-like, Strain CCMP1594" /NCGR_SAMPLE_ID=MMETSP0809 /ASSEMBLY_ACC=CAM_ASM_000658 /LENGTH=189 /DNA_ID=CAMNT_0015387319 /DNA_START=679 /DNA_END=1248 /DNA_ORIENTATION=+